MVTINEGEQIALPLSGAVATGDSVLNGVEAQDSAFESQDEKFDDMQDDDFTKGA